VGAVVVVVIPRLRLCSLEDKFVELFSPLTLKHCWLFGFEVSRGVIELTSGFSYANA